MISDAVAIGRGHIAADGVLQYRQQKTQGLAYCPWTCALPTKIAHMDEDRDLMHAAILPLAGHMTFLATHHARARSSKALGTMIRTAAREAGISKSAHGLRKARATALAEAGASVIEIAAWTGHNSLKEVEHYTRSADRRRAVMGTEQDLNSANTSETCAK